jgi:hypothetical protein
MGLIITSRDAFCVFGVKGGAWSTRGEIHFVSTLVWYGLVAIDFCPCCCRRVWSTHVEIHFVLSLANEGLLNTYWDAFCVLTGI